MNQELSKHQPEEILDQIEKIDNLADLGAEWLEKMMEQITATEKDCLTRIYTRFCLKKGKIFDFSKVSERDYAPMKPNYAEYYYKQGTADEYFLMSRELINDNGEVKLNVNFNPDLAYNNEL